MTKRNISKWVVITSIFPFTGLYSSINRNYIRAYPYVFAIFFFFIGTQNIVSDTNDIGRYMLNFLDIANHDNIPFWAYFYSLQEENQIDFYMPFMTWFISRFTSNSQVFVGILGMMFGLLFSFNFSYIAKYSSNKSFLYILLLFSLLFVPNTVFYTHRWWMAMQVFLLGVLPCVLEGKNKYLLFSIASIFVHFSFLYPLILLLIYKFLPKKTLIPFILIFVAANFIEDLNISSFAKAIEQYLPDSYNERNEAYINAELYDHNWFSQSGRFVWKYLNLFMTIYIYLKHKHILERRKDLKNLYIIALLIGSFAAIVNLTEWGWRYLDLTNFLFCSLYILILADSINKDKRFYKAIQIASPFFLYVIMFQIRGLFSIIGIKAFLFGNILTTWFINDTVSILSYLK